MLTEVVQKGVGTCSVHTNMHLDFRLLRVMKNHLLNLKVPTGFTIPDELTQLFDETVVDIYGDNPLPKPLFSEGGSNCYQAPDSEATMYYFSISESGEAYSYLLAIEGPLNLLIPGKDTATIAELKRTVWG